MQCLGAKVTDGLEIRAKYEDFAGCSATSRAQHRHQADLASGISLARRNSG
jgi:hypothetical protein